MIKIFIALSMVCNVIVFDTALASNTNASTEYLTIDFNSSSYTYPATITTTVISQNDYSKNIKREVEIELKFDDNFEIINPNSKISGYDPSYSCFATLVTNYTQYNDSTIKIYSVEGTRTVNDSTVKVYSQHVHIEYNGIDGNYKRDYYPNKDTKSWNIPISFPSVYMNGVIYGSKYTIELGRNSSARTW